MRSTRTRPLAALLVVCTLAASACGSDPEPAEELGEAIEALGDTSFEYTLTLDLSSDAAAELLGQEAGMVAGLVNSLAIRGVKDDGEFSLAAAFMGFEPLSLRSYDGGSELYVRVGLNELAESFGADLGDFGFDADAFADLPGDAGELFQRLFTGEWVGFTGLDPEDLGEEQQDAAADLGVDVEEFQELGEDIRARLGEIDQLLADLTIVSRSETDGVTTFDVVIRTEEALREIQSLLSPLMNALGEEQSEADLEADIQETLEGAPATLPGLTATVQDGDLTGIAFDVGALVLTIDEQAVLAPGDVVLRLEFAQHGAATVPDAPADAVTYDQEQLEQLSQLLADPSALLGAGLPEDQAGAGSPDAQAALLAGLQLSYFETNGVYTADLDELLAADDRITTVLRDDGRYGVCVTEDGLAFAVAAEIEGVVGYVDSDFRSTIDPAELPCVPELTGAP